jgi:outer membrane protein assembly factor BamD
MDKVYFFLGDSYYQWSLLANSPVKTDQSFPFFTKLVTDYPKSKYTEKAQDRLKEIQAAQKLVKK